MMYSTSIRTRDGVCFFLILLHQAESLYDATKSALWRSWFQSHINGGGGVLFFSSLRSLKPKTLLDHLEKSLQAAWGEYSSLLCFLVILGFLLLSCSICILYFILFYRRTFQVHHMIKDRNSPQIRSLSRLAIVIQADNVILIYSFNKHYPGLGSRLKAPWRYVPVLHVTKRSRDLNRTKQFFFWLHPGK